MAAPIVLPVLIGALTYRLTFKFGVIRIFEQEVGRPLAEIFAGMSDTTSEETVAEAAKRIPWDVWSALFWASLQPAHRITREGADDLIDEADLATVVEWVMRGLAAYNAKDPSLLTKPLEPADSPKPKGKAAKKNHPADADAGELAPGSIPAS